MYRLTVAQQHVVEQVIGIADQQIAPHAERIDREGAFPSESMKALGDHGFLDEVAQRCASTAMVYVMHLCGIACYAAAPEKTARHLTAAARGEHLTTLAFSEPGSRSHFWAPTSRAISTNGGVRINALKSFVTSAGHADGYILSTGAADAKEPLESTIYFVLRDDPRVAVLNTWDGLGMRGNASAAMEMRDVTLGTDRTLTQPGKGLDMMLAVVLPTFQIASAAVAVGIAEAACSITQRHVTTTRLEHQNSSLAEIPALRARLAQMRIETDRARAHLASVLDSVETPGPATQLLVLETKAAATEASVVVTDLAMRTCGGAAFGRRLGLERLFRDARGPIVMAPTTDQAYDFIGRALCSLEVF